MLKGDLKAISLVSLLQIFEAERKSGTLTLRYSGFEKTIYLSEGAITFLVSNDPLDFFGHFLVSKQLISEEDLVNAIKVQQQKGGLIGSILTKVGAISEQNLRSALRVKLEESIFQLFHLNQAEFELDEAERPEDTALPKTQDGAQPLCLPIQELLLEGMRRLDEHRRLKTVFPSLHLTFTVNRAAVTADLQTGGKVSNLLEQLEQGKTIEELCLHFHSPEFSILRLLDGLVKGKIIAPKAQSNAPSETVPVKPSAPKVEVGLMDIPHLTGKTDLSTGSFTALDGFVMSRVNGTWTIKDILSVVPAPKEEVTGSIARLVEEGLLRLQKGT